MSKFLDNNGVLYLWQKIKAALGGKVDKADGKGLSSNDYTTDEKTKLAGIAAGANKTVVEDVLTSTNKTHALSAAQGKALKDMIPTVTNDLTNDLKTNYDAAYTHSQAAHAPAGAQANVIESILVNGKAVTPANKAVSITVPTTVASLTDAGQYAKKTDIANVYKYKGSVANASALPTGATGGDVYNVEDTGMNYAWNGKEWDALGETFVIEALTNAEIDAIVAS